MRVLLIDDDPDVRMLAGFVLEAAGHTVGFAESGAQGIAAATGDFDVVLLDNRLGDMTGSDVLPALLAAAPARPVIFLTGTEDPDATRGFIEAGAAGVIAKPFDPEQLAARVAALCAQSGRGRAD